MDPWPVSGEEHHHRGQVKTPKHIQLIRQRIQITRSFQGGEDDTAGVLIAPLLHPDAGWCCDGAG